MKYTSFESDASEGGGGPLRPRAEAPTGATLRSNLAVDGRAEAEATAAAEGEGDLKMAEPKLENIKLPTKFPEQPWKKKKD